MREYLLNQLDLRVPDEHGNTKIEGLEMASRKLGREDILELELPLPACGEHIWDWYLQLQSTSETVTYQEIEAWSRLTNAQARPEEVLILMDMFGSRREWQRERSKAK